MMYVESMKNFLLANPTELMAVRFILASFLLCRHEYVEFMKNFLLADSSELMAVRLILAC